MASEATLELARNLARVADRHKGEDILILDVSKLHSLIDVFVVITAVGTKHAATIGEEAYRYVKSLGQRPWHREEASDWICCDFSDVVVHVFTPAARRYYDFASLWADAGKVEWSPAQTGDAVPA